MSRNAMRRGSDLCTLDEAREESRTLASQLRRDMNSAMRQQDDAVTKLVDALTLSFSRNFTTTWAEMQLLQTEMQSIGGAAEGAIVALQQLRDRLVVVEYAQRHPIHSRWVRFCTWCDALLKELGFRNPVPTTTITKEIAR